jgi:hypothetical protein
MKFGKDGPPSWAIFVLAGAVFCAWLADRQEAARPRGGPHQESAQTVVDEFGEN